MKYEGPEHLPVSEAWIMLLFNVTCTKMNCDVAQGQNNLRFTLTASPGDVNVELFNTNSMGDMTVEPSTNSGFRIQGYAQ